MPILVEAPDNFSEVGVEPDCSGVSWIIKFGHNSDAQSFCILHNVLDILDAIDLILCEGSIQCDVRERFKLPWKTVIVHDMPVENIKFSSCQDIQDLVNSRQRVESA